MSIFFNKNITNSNFIHRGNYSSRFLKKLKGSFLYLKKERPKLNSNKIQPNNFFLSYNNKFLKTKNRMLYRRTIVQSYRRNLRTSDAERVFFNYVNKNMTIIERKVLYKRKFHSNNLIYIYFKNRTGENTRVYITHRVKNTFVTIFRGKKYRDDNYGMRMIAKVSSGGIGYKGPKKSTIFARKAVIKEAGIVLTNKMTSLLDVVFTSNVSRWNRKAVRDLCPNVSYVSKIYITYNRSHGYRKFKNRKRV